MHKLWYRVDCPAAFDDLPELGMGYHFASRAGGRPSNLDIRESTFIILNGIIAIAVRDLAAATTPPTEDSEIEKLSSVTVVPEQDVEVFVEAMRLDTAVVERRRAHDALHGSPPLPLSVSGGQKFVRFSAFRRDRRISAAMELSPGSFATSSSDARAVPNALAAVARYALPNPAPPVWRFVISPTAGVRMLAGTVLPAFGWCGGGAEVEFVTATGPATVANPRSLAIL